jgi:hypothetical protein
MVISWNLGPGNGQADGIRQADLIAVGIVTRVIDTN